MKKHVKCAVIVFVCVLAEILLSNHTAIALKLGGYETVDLNVENAVLTKPDENFCIKNHKISLESGKFRFENVNTEIKNICIEVENGMYSYIDVNVAFTDDNFAFDDGFDYNQNTYKIYLDDHQKNYINFSSYGEVKTLQFKFNDSVGEFFEISSIKINAPPEFRFSVFRFAVFLFICLSIYYGAWKWKFTKKDYSLIVCGTALMCILLMTVMVLAVKLSDEELLEQYPLENQYTSDQYQQMFNSFHEGRLDINVNFNLEEFEQMTNPYDRSERHEADLSGDFWDRAYYNGKFYSYFGVAPVFTVYYPVYLLTGKLPSAILASTITTIYSLIFLSLLYIVILKRFCKDVPLIPALLGHLALIFGSSILALNTEKLFYFIAVISGIGWLSAFLYFILKAYYEENLKKRIAFLILSGISAVLVAASRPTMLIYCVSAIVPAVFILGDKKETLKNKIIYVCSIGIPLLLGAIGLMTYNYLRFDSPFEFGFNYQLTVSIADANKITLAYIPATLYHYFFQSPVFKAKFPFIELNSKNLALYPRYTYISSSFGVFAYPVTWGIGLYPISHKKENKFKTFFILTLLVSAILLSFVDMCKAGAHYRYIADILLPIILVALVTIFDVLYMLSNAPKRIYATAYIFTLIAMIATVVLGYLLMFANENEYFMYDYAILTQVLRNV